MLHVQGNRAGKRKRPRSSPSSSSSSSGKSATITGSSGGSGKRPAVALVTGALGKRKWGFGEGSSTAKVRPEVMEAAAVGGAGCCWCIHEKVWRGVSSRISASV